MKHGLSEGFVRAVTLVVGLFVIGWFCAFISCKDLQDDAYDRLEYTHEMIAKSEWEALPGRTREHIKSKSWGRSNWLDACTEDAINEIHYSVK